VFANDFELMFKCRRYCYRFSRACRYPTGKGRVHACRDCYAICNATKECERNGERNIFKNDDFTGRHRYHRSRD
jgi:hypothetical protein